MTYQQPLMADVPHETATISVMRCRDPFELNPDPLTQLFLHMSVPEAEDIICRVLEDIAQRLDHLQAARTLGTFKDIHTPARRIAAVARQIGLISVTTAADHVACAAQGQNAVAVGATLARLERSFDVAVSRVWGVQDHVAR